MKVFAIGASRNIGYESSLRFLKAGGIVIFLLRSPSVFDNDDEIKPFVTSGQARLVKGDAMNVEDIRRGWLEATQDGPVDLVVVSLGATPSFSPTKGFVISPENLCSTAAFNVLSTFPSTPGTPQPKLIAVTSHGITKETHSTLPFLVKGLFTLIHQPHADKLAMERVITYSAGVEWKEGDNKANEQLLPTGWQEKLPSPGWLKSAVIIRAAILTDGESKGQYRVDENISSPYTISRKDVAHFITGECLENWAKYENKGISIGY